MILPQSLLLLSEHKLQAKGIFIEAMAEAEQVAAGGWAAQCFHPSTFPPWELQKKSPSN